MTQVYLAIGAPFVAAVVGLLAGRLRPRVVVPVAITGTTLSLVAALVMAGRAITTDGLLERSSLDTVPLGGGLTFGLDLRLDGLAALVSVAVAVVALMVQVYSTAYLKGDPRYSSYAALVSLFTAAMLLVVFADDLFVLLSAGRSWASAPTSSSATTGSRRARGPARSRRSSPPGSATSASSSASSPSAISSAPSASTAS